MEGLGCFPYDCGLPSRTATFRICVLSQGILPCLQGRSLSSTSQVTCSRGWESSVDDDDGVSDGSDDNRVARSFYV